MKKKMLTPIAAIAVATFTMVGCASSNDGMNDTTAMDGTTMSETETMAGSTDTDIETTTDVTTDEVTTDVNTGMSTDMTYANMFEDVNTEQYDIMSLARSNSNLSTFVSLAEMAGMEAAIKNAGSNFTVFIPTNEAFESLPKEDYDRLTNPANQAELIKVLQAHILPNNVSANQFQNNQRIETTDGKTIDVAVSSAGGTTGVLTIGGATVVKPDVKVSNGIVHIVDGVIMPTDKNGMR
jgi:uncharacterized surface protein with fasciclin (FAS1) repeats